MSQLEGQGSRCFKMPARTAAAAAAAAKSLQSCPTLCNPRDDSPPGSPIPGILRARTLERVAISFSNAWKWKVKVKSLSRVWLLATPWTASYQAPLPMGFSRLQQGTSITHHVDLFTGLLERLVGWPLAPQSECPRESMVTTSLMP